MTRMGCGGARARPVMHIAALLAAVLALAAAPGRATAADVTLLHLSATGTVREVPDLLVAQLLAESSAAGPASAQQQVNRRMAAAAHEAGLVQAVTWRLEGYTVDSNEQKPLLWTARQTLRLEAADAGALLELTGRLQDAGLAIEVLSWTLSPEHLAAAQARASDQALRALRRQAEAAATSLGLRVGSIREVTLGSRERVRPMQRMMGMMATAEQAPRATQDAQDIDEEASADFELHP